MECNCVQKNGFLLYFHTEVLYCVSSELDLECNATFNNCLFGKAALNLSLQYMKHHINIMFFSLQSA